MKLLVVIHIILSMGVDHMGDHLRRFFFEAVVRDLSIPKGSHSVRKRFSANIFSIKQGFVELYTQRLIEGKIYKLKLHRQAIHIPKLRSSVLEISKPRGLNYNNGL